MNLLHARSPEASRVLRIALRMLVDKVEEASCATFDSTSESISSFETGEALDEIGKGLAEGTVS